MGRNDTFDSRRSKFHKGDFFGEVNGYILAVGWDYRPSPGFSMNVWGEVSSNEFLQISHDYVTENACFRQNF